MLLPVVNVTFSRGSNKVVLPCLIDTGSQVSYLSLDAINSFNIPTDNPITRNIYCVGKKVIEQGFEISVELQPPDMRKIEVPIFVKSDFSLNLKIDKLGHVLLSIRANGIKISKHFPSYENGNLEIIALLGCDLIEFLPEFKIISCLRGNALQLPSGIIPVGDIENFLPDLKAYPIDQEYSKRSIMNNKEEEIPAVAHSAEVISAVNFILNPKNTYFSPLNIVSDESVIDQGVENMFAVESIGIKDSSDISSYDEVQIEKFKNGISIKNNVYHVELPWHPDIIDKVPANYEVAVAIAFNITDRLTKQGMLNDYNEVFQQQLKEGIIERIPEITHKGDGHIWIPHRPVIKSEGESTTKIRPVFNCSLKTGKNPSLNEAAYAGLDLMSGLLDLLLKFRSNDYFMLADIKQAFLQIKLSKLEDKNRFSFLLVENGKLVAYRYTSIVFGFISSPFILNYIIKEHIAKYPQAICHEPLNNNLYVDNLIVTNNDH